MDSEYTYGEDGIPVLIDHSTSHSSPPSSKSRLLKNAEGRRKDSDLEETGEYVYQDDAKAVFTIDGEGYDVILSEKRGKIFWTPMSALGMRRKSARKLSGLLRSRRSSYTEDTASEEGLSLSKLFGVYVKHQFKTDKDTGGCCTGLVLCMLEDKNENTLRETITFLEHPSEELCSAWEKRIKTFIRATHPERPVTIKLFLQPHAGSKTGQLMFQKTILPLFQSAGVCVDTAEVIHNEYVKQEIIHLNLDDFDCIACMGGDGTVSQVVDALMNRAQKEKEVDIRQGCHPAQSPLPLGIIPTGRTNHVAQSVMGVTDPVTAVLHIIHGNFHPVDLCTMHTPDKFLRWGFNCQYGFAGQVLTYIGRYKALGIRRMDAAFVKALTKAKLRAYECDIEYIPASVEGTLKNTQCMRGCSVCQSNDQRSNKEEEIAIDFVQELDPLNQSFNSNTSSVIDLPQDNLWRTLKGKYMNVGLFTIPGLCDLAPQGLSKFTHLNDGIIDLVLVKETERKEFVRYLRRHGNSKNQFDFPFIEVHKAKEVRFRPRFPLSWNYNDHDFSEIKYQMQREESKVQSRKSMGDINVLSHMSQSMDILDMSDDEDVDEAREINNREKTVQEKPQLVGPQYRKTFFEIEVEKQKKHARKKEEKQKAKEEAKMLAVWNIDNQIVRELTLDIKVHHGLLKVSGLGVSPHTAYEDIRLGCLSAM